MSRLRRYDLNGEFLTTLIVAVALTGLTYLFATIELTKDKMVPFRSTGFVLGAGGVFYIAFAHGTRQGLYLAAGVSTLILLVWLDLDGQDRMSMVSIAVQLPLVALFLVGLCVLPNVLPWQYEQDIATLAAKNRELDKTLTRLREQFHKIQQQEIIEKSALAKQEQIRVSSRSAFLNSFARELLQASSNRELLNLLFHNMTRLMQLEECVMLLVGDDAKEAVIVRALHPKSQDIENQRLPVDHAILAPVITSKKPAAHTPPAPLMDGVVTRYLVPVIAGDAVIALFSLGSPKGAELLPDDEEFVVVLVTMLSGAMEQLRISSATS